MPAASRHLAHRWGQVASSCWVGPQVFAGSQLQGIGWAPVGRSACRCGACCASASANHSQQAHRHLFNVTKQSKQAGALLFQYLHRCLHDEPAVAFRATARPAACLVDPQQRARTYGSDQATAWAVPPVAASALHVAGHNHKPLPNAQQPLAWDAELQSCGRDLKQIHSLVQHYVDTGLSPARIQQVIALVGPGQASKPAHTAHTSPDGQHQVWQLCSALAHASLSWLRDQQCQAATDGVAPTGLSLSPALTRCVAAWQHAQLIITCLGLLHPLITTSRPHRHNQSLPAGIEQLELLLRQALQHTATPTAPPPPHGADTTPTTGPTPLKDALRHSSRTIYAQPVMSGLVPHLIPATQLLSALQAMLDAGVQDTSAYTALGDLLLGLLPHTSSHQRHTTPPRRVSSTHLGLHHLAAIIIGMSQARCHHTPLFTAVSDALLGGRQVEEGSQGTSGGALLERLPPADLASLIVACVQLDQPWSPLMDACCQEAIRWLGQQVESSLLGLLSRVTRAKAAVNPPEPHPLQPFSLVQLSDMASALIASHGPLSRAAAGLLDAISQEAAAQLLALVEGGRRGAATTSTDLPPNTCTAIVGLVAALHSRGAAKPLVLDAAAAVLAPRLEGLPVQDLLQLLRVFSPAVPPSAQLCSFRLRQITTSEQLSNLQHHTQLCDALMVTLVTHVNELTAEEVASVGQCVAAARYCSLELQRRLGYRMAALLGQQTDQPHVPHQVTLDSCAALPAAVQLVVAQASQGYRHTHLLTCVDTVCHVCAHHVGIHTFLTPADVIGLSAAYAQLAAHGPAVLDAAIRLATSATRPSPSSRPAISPHAPQQHDHRTSGVTPAGATPRLTLSQLAQLLWSLLITPHVATIQHNHPQPRDPPEAADSHPTAASQVGSPVNHRHEAGQAAAAVTSNMLQRSNSHAYDLNLVLSLYGQALHARMDDVFDPTVILLAQVHMLLLSRLGPGFIELLVGAVAQLPAAAAWSPTSSSSAAAAAAEPGAVGGQTDSLDAASVRPAVTQLVNSLQYAWGQHLKALNQGQAQPVTHNLTGGSSKQDGYQQLHSRELQAKLLRAMRCLRATDTSEMATALSRSCRPVWLKVDGFPVHVDVAGEAGGHMLAVMCHGADRVCTVLSSAHEVTSSQLGTIVLGEVVWLEVLLQQLGWLVVQVPGGDWQEVVCAEGVHDEDVRAAHHLWRLLRPVIMQA